MWHRVTLVSSLAAGGLALAAATAPAQELPASGTDPERRLAESPRHGEWVTYEAPGDDRVSAWVVYPERSDPAPVVIVIHEIFGLTDWIRAVADQLAAEGFVAIAPDLLSGKGPGGGGTASFEGDEVRRAIRDLDPGEIVRRLDGAARYAADLPAARDAFAVIGFCWGGSTSYFYATRQSRLAGAVVYYGTSPDGGYERINAPVLGLYAADDARVNETIPAAQQVMGLLGKRYEVEIYEGAGHGFLRAQDGRDGANGRAAEQAWPRTVEFLREALGEGN